MLKLVFCIRRKSGLSRGEFQRYWLEQHAPLVDSVAQHLGAQRYVQSHTIDSDIADASNKARGSHVEPYDGITEFWWESEAAMRPNDSSNEALIQAQKTLLNDECKFIDVTQSVIFITHEHEIYSR